MFPTVFVIELALKNRLHAVFIVCSAVYFDPAIQQLLEVLSSDGECPKFLTRSLLRFYTCIMLLPQQHQIAKSVVIGDREVPWTVFSRVDSRFLVNVRKFQRGQHALRILGAWSPWLLFLSDDLVVHSWPQTIDRPEQID